MNKFNTDEIITNDAHLIQSFADLNGLKQADARTVIVEAEGAYVLTQTNKDDIHVWS